MLPPYIFCIRGYMSAKKPASISNLKHISVSQFGTSLQPPLSRGGVPSSCFFDTWVQRYGTSSQLHARPIANNFPLRGLAKRLNASRSTRCSIRLRNATEDSGDSTFPPFHANAQVAVRSQAKGQLLDLQCCSKDPVRCSIPGMKRAAQPTDSWAVWVSSGSAVTPSLTSQVAPGKFWPME